MQQTDDISQLDQINPPTHPTEEDIKYQATIAVFNLKEVAVRNQAPLLVQAVVVGPLDHIGPGIFRTAGNVHDQFTFDVYDLIVSSIRNQSPLLVEAVMVGPLDHTRSSVC